AWSISDWDGNRRASSAWCWGTAEDVGRNGSGPEKTRSRQYRTIRPGRHLCRASGREYEFLFFSKFLWEDIRAKYKKPGEMPAQIMQRYGQSFHMLFLGSATASWIGQVAN